MSLVFQVSALFKDGTIGGNINIAIVGLILLEEEQVWAPLKSVPQISMPTAPLMIMLWIFALPVYLDVYVCVTETSTFCI